jgi:hypothetical protein
MKLALAPAADANVPPSPAETHKLLCGPGSIGLVSAAVLGVRAVQPRYLGTVLNAPGSRTRARFVSKCDAVPCVPLTLEHGREGAA